MGVAATLPELSECTIQTRLGEGQGDVTKRGSS